GAAPGLVKIPPGDEKGRRTMLIRPVQAGDAAGLWRILEPMIRAGDSYPLPRGMREQEARAYWLQPAHAVFVVEAEGALLGTYYLRANQTGAGAHVANCGYVTACAARRRAGAAFAPCSSISCWPATSAPCACGRIWASPRLAASPRLSTIRRSAWSMRW